MIRGEVDRQDIACPGTRSWLVTPDGVERIRSLLGEGARVKDVRGEIENKLGGEASLAYSVPFWHLSSERGYVRAT